MGRTLHTPGELCRHNVLTNKPCDWCGRTPESGKLFAYFTVLDTVFMRELQHAGLFCRIACFRAFHGVEKHSQLTE